MADSESGMSDQEPGLQDSELFSYVDPSPPLADGPLAGKSVVIQPNMSVRGWPTEAGSAALEKFVALEDATSVERLRAAGAKIVGSVRMAELGLGLAGDSTARVLSEGRCEVGLITDTMGEARLAASAAGAVALKPSYGIISRYGLIGLVPSMECYGLIAKTPGEVAGVLAALAGADERDPSMLEEVPPGLTDLGGEGDGMAVAGVACECVDALDSADRDAFQAALSRMEAANTRVQEVSLPDFDLFRLVHNVVGSAEASSSAGKYDGVRYGHRAPGTENWNEMYLESRAESFGPLVKSYLFQGAYYQFQDYAAFESACRIRRRLVRMMEALFETVDVLVCPTRRAGHDAEAATTIDEVYDAFALALPANVTGQPCLSVPGLVCDGDFDAGLQIAGPPLSDARLLAFAARLVGSEP